MQLSLSGVPTIFTGQRERERGTEREREREGVIEVVRERKR